MGRFNLWFQRGLAVFQMVETQKGFAYITPRSVGICPPCTQRFRCV
jgi:hypothetical protein